MDCLVQILALELNLHEKELSRHLDFEIGIMTAHQNVYLFKSVIIFQSSYTAVFKLMQNGKQFVLSKCSIPTDSNPRCLHTTIASRVSQKSSHTVPYSLL